MNKNDVKFYSQTKFPNIFKNSYWGNFSGKGDQSIFNNRNNFVLEYDVKAYKKMPLYIQRPLYAEMNETQDFKYDHLELYVTKDKKYILICSPYGDEYDDEFYTRGWMKIDKLYSPSASTYMIFMK